MNRSACISLSATALTLLLTACGSTSNPLPSTSDTQHVSAQGSVFGGEQPITAAAVQLYAVNTATNGGASTALITGTTVTTSDGSGNTTNNNAQPGNNYNRFPAGFFTITGDYTCPSSSTLVYLTYSGGNPGAGTNNAQRGLVALGPCGNLSASTNVTINELTTVGAVAALHNYMTAYNAIGSTAANASALATAFNNAAEYVNSATGTAPGTSLPAGADADSNDLRALANIVQSCVNSDGNVTSGHPCYTLFTTAQGTAGSMPTDTVSALLDIAADPTNNVAALFALQSSTPAYEPTNTTAPTDWSLPLLTAPTISPNGGSFTSATNVTLTDTDPAATIYYTTNGNTPTSSSTKYTAPFTLSASATVKAIAISPSGMSSPVASALFTINIPIQLVPTVSLSAATTATGSQGGLLLLASSNATGSTVTFGTAGSIGGSFNPTTCVIASGGCTTVYTPTGALSPSTYSNDFTASFGATSGYLSSSASSTLIVNTTSLTPSILFVFTGTTGPYIGRSPEYVNLIQASDGLLYGTTRAGGSTSAVATGSGVVFGFSPTTQAYTVPYSFTGGTSDANEPYTGVIQSPADGELYGTTTEGGSPSSPTNYGDLYKVGRPGTSGGETILHPFLGTNADGQSPYSTVVPGTDGNLYGAMYSAGAQGNGSIYRTSGTGDGYTQIFNFTSATTGGYPRGSLVQHPADNYLYGTASLGGASSGGTVFKIDTAGDASSLVVLHTFYTSTTDGKAPEAGLIVGPDSFLYGTTAQGGTNAGGTLFKIDYQGNNYQVLYNFAATSTDGKTPFSSLFLGTDGFLYGTTEVGGSSSKGTVYRISTTGANYSVLYNFGALPDGETPFGGLLQASDGNFYGTTSLGGNATNSFGTVFRMSSGPAPVQIAVPSTITHGSTFPLAYAVSNAYSSTLQTCFATNNGGDVTGWTGTKAATVAPKTVTLTAPSSGTYTYSLTCGGTESGFVTFTVQ